MEDVRSQTVFNLKSAGFICMKLVYKKIWMGADRKKMYNKGWGAKTDKNKRSLGFINYRHDVITWFLEI